MVKDMQFLQKKNQIIKEDMNEKDKKQELKCELCDHDYLENYDEGEAISVEEYENLDQWGRCNDCISEYGTDGYPDR